jgi:hypothetical protein
VSVATGEAERQWIGKGVDNHVDFRRKAAMWAADSLIVTLPLRASALCWCALKMVASIIASSLSGSSAKVLKRFFNAIKHCRAIATSYEKTAPNFLAGLHPVCAFTWLMTTGPKFSLG